ncbi:hypothetical protein D0T49_11335 [Paludibacter sp. 221]|uniref:hypothetical protein n=1 Tax=Paludibacter sp. 221 TaxID=2302939 RepID=UPI0013D17667|nr:hypothetical protein [Paludibacter sp. 221]NDV47639.1 hypothetical protein [Paludibacter sp. 221]
MAQKNNITQVIFIIGGILTIIGAILQIINYVYAPFVFSGGGLLLVYCHVMNSFAQKEDDFRSRRLSRIGFISSLLLILSAYLMFTGSNSWVVFLLIYAAISLFLSFRAG